MNVKRLLFCMAGFALAGCAGHSNQTVSHSQQSTSTNMAYMCSMHPEVTSSQPGKCPKCGMMLAATQPTTQPAPAGHVH
jgi:hypothetical protein